MMWNLLFSSCSFFKKFNLIFLTLVVFVISDTLSFDFEPGGKSEVKIINPDADAIIGAVIGIRERGSGLFGCGDRKIEGVITADALKWMTEELNSKIWSESSSNVSLGLYIMDNCDRTRTAASQLIDFLPELQTVENSSKKNSSFKFCVIDDTELENEADIMKSLDDIKVAVVDTKINANSPQVLSSVVLLFIQEIQWENFAIVHSNSKFSLSMLKQFTKQLKNFDVCIPWVVNIEDDDGGELISVIKSGIPVVSLLTSEEHFLLLKFFQDLPSPKKKVSVMFTDLVSRNQLKMITPKDFQILSVTPLREKEMNFEKFFLKNSLMSGIRTEDDLDLAHRIKTVRKIRQIAEKVSESLRDAVEILCKDKQTSCRERLMSHGRRITSENLSKCDWTDSGLFYELVEYRYQFPDDHIHLHKIMAYKGHKNLDIYETNLSFENVNCDEENDSRPECRCLELKSIRSGSARNIVDWGKKKQWQSKVFMEKDKQSLPTAEFNNHHVGKPMVFASLNDPFKGTLASLSLLGGLLTLIIVQYFATFAALPHGGITSGTSVIGYVILIGLLLLFTANLSFLLTPLISTCTLRRFCMSFAYAVIFSGMLIKVWSSLRQVASEKVKLWKPFTLLLYSIAFSLFQVLPAGLWLILKPPATEFASGKWVCYPSGDLDSHLIISMFYPMLLLIVTLITAVRTCSKSNSDEARWILISSSLVAIIFSCWGVATATGVWQSHRTACTNLAVGAILLVCLYIPKIKMHYKLKKSLKSQMSPPPITRENDKECPVLTPKPTFPVVLGYNVVGPTLPEEIIESNYLNQAYSIGESSETVSTPFDIDTSSYSDIEQEPYTFSTFLEEPQVAKIVQDDVLEDPTQVVPSALYPVEMFSNEPIAITSDHCQPGTNEFTPPHRTTSQLYLCPQPEWVP